MGYALYPPLSSHYGICSCILSECTSGNVQAHFNGMKMTHCIVWKKFSVFDLSSKHQLKNDKCHSSGNRNCRLTEFMTSTVTVGFLP